MTFPRTTKISVPFVYKGKDLGIVADVVTYQNEYSKSKLLNHKVIMPCGQHSHYYNAGAYLTKASSQEIGNVVASHVNKCRACWVALGTSKADVMTQDEVAALFSRGIDGKRSSSGNLRSSDGVLTHYRTTEAIRMPDGTIIDNSECWAAGFASCPHVPNTAFALPLTTMSNILSDDDMRLYMKVLDRNDSGAALFTVSFPERPVRYFITGVDEGQLYLNELYGTPQTLAEAFESMKPMQVREYEGAGGKDMVRQGDLFFVPLPGLEDKMVEMQVGMRIEKTAILVNVNGRTDGYHYGNNRIDHSLPKDFRAMDSEYFTAEYKDGSTRERAPANVPVIHQVEGWERNTITNPRQNLLGTRHIASKVGVLGRSYRGVNLLVAKGTVRHGGRDHRMLKLGDTWHAVFGAIVKRSFNRGGRTLRGRGD